MQSTSRSERTIFCFLWPSRPLCKTRLTKKVRVGLFLGRVLRVCFLRKDDTKAGGVWWFLAKWWGKRGNHFLALAGFSGAFFLWVEGGWVNREGFDGGMGGEETYQLPAATLNASLCEIVGWAALTLGNSVFCSVKNNIYVSDGRCYWLLDAQGSTYHEEVVCWHVTRTGRKRVSHVRCGSLSLVWGGRIVYLQGLSGRRRVNEYAYWVEYFGCCGPETHLGFLELPLLPSDFLVTLVVSLAIAL